MSFSNLWARFCALFVTTAKKGAINLDLQPTDATTDAPAALATAIPGAADVSAAADIPVSAAAAIALASPALLGTFGALPGDIALGAAGQVAAVAPLVAPSADSPLPVVPAVVAPADADDEPEDSDELESLKAIAGGGSELFLTVLKDLVSFAIGLGHDVDTAFDAAVIRTKTLVAKL